jgi:hypothetical protein
MTTRRVAAMVVLSGHDLKAHDPGTLLLDVVRRLEHDVNGEIDKEMDGPIPYRVLGARLELRYEARLEEVEE